MTEMAETTTIPLNTRIRDTDGFVGTVAYIGSVASSKNPKEQYAGIVWDDSSRGKHDGSVVCRQTNQIVRHFSCGPTQGSFLKVRKLDTGVTLNASLLRNKYVEMNAPVIAPNNILPHTVKTSSGREKTIEFYGELQIRKRQQLENIDKFSLRREGISKASKREDMADFKHIKDIDLAGNLLCSWPEVLKIIHQFPLLENFSLAHNYVRDLDVGSITGVKFDNMKVLNLNNCMVQSFKTIERVAETMPNLESLCIANSNLLDIRDSDSIQGFQNLKLLDCSNCGFDAWENQVSRFSTLPLLETLSIDDNPIPSIPSGAGASPLFPSLMSLQITGIAASTWMDLEAINSIATLKSLRFKNIPLTANLGQGDVRSTSIARFPGLEYLNASLITRDERNDAERRYVTLVSNAIQKGNFGEDEKTAFLDKHPRYLELTEKHEKLTAYLKNRMEKGGNLATSIYNITIKSMAASSCTMEPIVRRLPGTMNVERMKALCSRAFNIDYDIISLRFRTDSSLPIEMEDDSKTIDYYGLCDGAEILVDEIDLRARALDMKRNDEQLEERISELGKNIAMLQSAKTER